MVVTEPRRILFRITVPLALLAASCDRELPADEGGFNLRINPQVNSFAGSPEVSDAGSRAIIEGAAFPNGTEVGYVVLGSANAYRNAGLPHMNGYGNIRAQAANSDGQWLYYINQTQSLGTSVPGLPSYGNIDIYGYHPYRSDFSVDDLHAIPFSLGTVSQPDTLITTAAMVENDYMYAQPVLNYTMRAGETARMNFRHVMTCLEFRIRKTFAGPALTLSTIDFTIEGNDRAFTVSGTFDAADGSVVRGPSATRILVDYNKTLANTNAGSSATISCSLMLPSLDCAGVGATDDATVTAVLHFTDQDGGQWQFHDGNNAVYTFRLSQVTDSRGNRGLCAGNRYQVITEVSNFVKYSGVPTIVLPDWETDSENTPPNVI